MASDAEFCHNIVTDFALIRVVVPLRPSQIRDKLTKPKFCSENEKRWSTSMIKDDVSYQCFIWGFVALNAILIPNFLLSMPIRYIRQHKKLKRPKFCSEDDKNDQTPCSRLKVKNANWITICLPFLIYKFSYPYTDRSANKYIADLNWLSHIILILWKGDAESYKSKSTNCWWGPSQHCAENAALQWFVTVRSNSWL